MKMTIQKVLALLMAVTVMLSVPMDQVQATENVKMEVEVLPSVVTEFVNGIIKGARATTFNDTGIDVACSSDGMYVVITTSMTKLASVVGVKDVTVDQLIDGEWYTVATTSGGELTNAYGCTISFTYDGAVYGETYRITCIHYGNVDGYRELEHITGNFKFVY